MILALYYAHFLFNIAVKSYIPSLPLILPLYISPFLIYKYIEDKTHRIIGAFNCKTAKKLIGKWIWIRLNLKLEEN
jgi:hypothetical protein